MIRIAIVDDHAVLRAGLKQFLAEVADLCVTGEASNGREALELARQGQADVMLMDISMPGQSGVDALVAIKARFPALPVLMLSSFAEGDFATTLLRQGAAGYLNKDSDPDEVVKAIRTVAQGRRYIGTALAEVLAEGVAHRGDRPAHELLSDREFQVFLRLANGEAIGGVALGMFLSAKTVSTYRARVLAKLGVACNSDLTYYALKHGLIA
jgi:two-component system, NarL family, invasion response regulator UvrY